MRIAVIGAGVSGLVAARLLSEDHEVTIFESGRVPGGHAHTIDVDLEGRRYPVDTGFVVFNKRTYPNFLALLRRLGVAFQPADMSFSVRCERTGLEYCGASLNRLFAQRRNLVRPTFHRMLADIVGFNRLGSRIENDSACTRTSLRSFVKEHRFSNGFVHNYLVPMAAAIWSCAESRVLEFPVGFFLRFFRNHGLLKVRGQHQWYSVTGGSRTYVEALARPIRDRIRLSSPVSEVRRETHGVRVTPLGGASEEFDHVVMATHGDRTYRMLKEPSEREREILTAFEYQANEVVLHTDRTLLPRRNLAWACWNYHIPREEADRVRVTYNMSMLQRIDSPVPFCVTLNRSDEVDPDRVLRRMRYDHPVYGPAALAAQARHEEISGASRIHYCGAYWGNGFHEDGVNSALRVCRWFGKTLA